MKCACRQTHARGLATVESVQTCHRAALRSAHSRALHSTTLRCSPVCYSSVHSAALTCTNAHAPSFGSTHHRPLGGPSQAVRRSALASSSSCPLRHPDCSYPQTPDPLSLLLSDQTAPTHTHTYAYTALGSRRRSRIQRGDTAVPHSQPRLRLCSLRLHLLHHVHRSSPNTRACAAATARRTTTTASSSPPTLPLRVLLTFEPPYLLANCTGRLAVCGVCGVCAQRRVPALLLLPRFGVCPSCVHDIAATPHDRVIPS